jgi:hypothetical protein
VAVRWASCPCTRPGHAAGARVFAATPPAHLLRPAGSSTRQPPNGPDRGPILREPLVGRS